MATAISTLADNVQSRVEEVSGSTGAWWSHGNSHLSWQFLFGQTPYLIHPCARREFLPWAPAELSSFCLEVKKLMTVWAKNLQVVIRAIGWVAIFVMNFENSRFFIPTANLTLRSTLRENLRPHFRARSITFCRLILSSKFKETLATAKLSSFTSKLIVPSLFLGSTIDAIENHRCRSGLRPSSSTVARTCSTAKFGSYSVLLDKKRFPAVLADAFEINWHKERILYISL